MPYPKPQGWNGGPDGHILRQGSAGTLGWNPNTDEGEEHARLNRQNCLSFDEADFGGLHGGQCDHEAHEDVNEDY